jgi:hypothetical protein
MDYDEIETIQIYKKRGQTFMGIDQSKHLLNQDQCKQKHMFFLNGDREIQICVVEQAFRCALI